jgi:hypothetical protein
MEKVGTVIVEGGSIESVKVNYGPYIDAGEKRWRGLLFFPEGKVLPEGSICELVLDEGKRGSIYIKERYKDSNGDNVCLFEVIDTIEGGMS